MTENRKTPPAAALWLLRHVYPGSDGEALAGDLLERFAEEARSPVWFWRQTAIAIAASVPGAMWRHWPEFSYAAFTIALHLFLSEAATKLFAMLEWWNLPWPASQIALEAGPALLLNLVALWALGACLQIAGRFRRSSLLVTAALAFVFTLLAVNVVFMLLGPPRAPGWWRLPVPFASLTAAAWVGCRFRPVETRPASLGR